MSKIAGIYIKVGDDLVGDYAAKYLSDLPDYEVWPDQEVLAWLIRSIEGLFTYHEERQKGESYMMENEVMTPLETEDRWADYERKAALERGMLESSPQLYITYSNLNLDLPQE